MLTGGNLETMSALTLMSYPFEGRPVYLALAPLTHAAGVLCFPVMACGGEVVVMPRPDLTEFLQLIERHRVTHTFLPPTLIYMLLVTFCSCDHGPDIPAVFLVRRRADLSGSARGGDRCDRTGDGATVRADRGPDDDLDDGAGRPFRGDGAIARGRLSSAGRPSPLVTRRGHGRRRQSAAIRASGARSWSAVRW